MNIGAVEKTRIRIHSADGTTNGYINANYIDVSVYRLQSGSLTLLVCIEFNVDLLIV